MTSSSGTKESPTLLDRHCCYRTAFYRYGMDFGDVTVDRLDAYCDAILGNKEHFEGKVVLDVGCGSGVLALAAARAGAKRVYAVEATDLAETANELVSIDGSEQYVTVIQSTLEDLQLPEKVDIIVSDCMGDFFLSESAIGNVLLARDKFLESDGAVYPSHVELFLAPVTSSRTLTRACNVGVTEPSQLLGAPVMVKKIDMLSATLTEFTGHINQIEITANASGSLDLFVGWFKLLFEGSPFSPGLVHVDLDTGPRHDSEYCWRQEGFPLQQSVGVSAGDTMTYNLEVPVSAFFQYAELTCSIRSPGQPDEEIRWCRGTIPLDTA